MTDLEKDLKIVSTFAVEPIKYRITEFELSIKHCKKMIKEFKNKIEKCQ